MSPIYKIATASLWREAESQGRFTGAPIDLKDGYIHFSTAGQARETVALHFKGQDDLVIAAIDTETLKEHLKWEASRGGALFQLCGVADGCRLLGQSPADECRWQP